MSLCQGATLHARYSGRPGLPVGVIIEESIDYDQNRSRRPKLATTGQPLGHLFIIFVLLNFLQRYKAFLKSLSHRGIINHRPVVSPAVHRHCDGR